MCCICQTNEREREVQHKTGAPGRRPVKNMRGMAHPGPPLKPPMGNTRTKHNQLPAITWNFYHDAQKLLQADDCIIM